MATRTPAVTLLGRHDEVRASARFLDAAAGGRASVLLLSGPAGIGKTAVWRAGIEAARERGFRVVTAQPSEVETGLAFAALGDLLGPLLDGGSDAAASMPEPQRRALDAALLRAPATTPPQPLGVSLATLHVLRAAAADTPVLVAIDDVPWLDEASGRALGFAIRRLGDVRVGYLLARRAAEPSELLPAWLEATVPDVLERLDLGPLSAEQVGSLLRHRLGLTLTRPVLTRLHTISGGTPFYALELARDLQARGGWDRPDALDAPRTLERLVGARISALEPEGDDVALVSAAVAHATIPLLEAALGARRAQDGLADAERAGVLERLGDDIRFVHPLLAAAAYARARPDRRRHVHAVLAGIVADPEERGRHLARTAVGPDAAIATALEDAATTALRRGASEVAAELAEEATRLTPTDAREDQIRRQLLAADDRIVSGDMVRADELLAAVERDLEDGPRLAEVLMRRARIALYRTQLDHATQLVQAALPLAESEPALHVNAHALLAGIAHLTWRDWRRGRWHMWTAERLAAALRDQPLEAQILGHAGSWRFGLGRAWRPLIAQVDALDVPLAAVPALEHPDQQFARLLAREGDASEARRRMQRLIAGARAAGDWTSLPRLLVGAGGIELEAGDWERAAAIVDEADAGLLHTGEGAFYLDLANLRLNLAVLRGDVAAARATGEALEREVRDLPKPLVRTAPRLALGHLELSLGDAEAALAWLDPVVAETGLGRLLPIWWESAVALHTEALLGVGRVDDTRDRIDRLVRRARRRGPDAALAEALRARALVLAAQGDADAALADAQEAVRRLDTLTLPFRSARADLTLGDVLRRSRQRSAARAAFQRAADRFGALGSGIWADRARAEAARVAPRRPAGSPLTDTERRIAELAGSGHSNKEIADALFMSTHTVEAHLTRIFRTLGIQSRVELARLDLGTVETSETRGT
jgi:DNA-binding CsgD family transcriptional regulator